MIGANQSVEDFIQDFEDSEENPNEQILGDSYYVESKKDWKEILHEAKAREATILGILKTVKRPHIQDFLERKIAA